MKYVLLTISLSVLAINSTIANTLKEVVNRGELICGIHGSLHGMSHISKSDKFIGFDVDFCKAVAAAVLNDTNAIDFITLTSKIRFKSLENKDQR